MTPRIVLTLTIGLAAAAAEAGTLVAFHETASVSEGVVTLRDLADVHGDDPATVQKLTTIILGPAPDAGRETQITFETIRSRLMAAGMNLAEVEFSGSSLVSVRGTASPAPSASPDVPKEASPALWGRTEQAVAAAVKRYLESQQGLKGISVELKLPVGDAVALAPAVLKGFEISGGAAPWLGPQIFLVRYLDDVEAVREARVACIVAHSPSVPVARQALPKGHVLRADDLIWKPLEAGFDGPHVADPGQLIGRETQQTLRTGQPIPPDAVRSVPLIRTGQFVNVTSRRPGVAVQRVMKAKANGASGETIPALTLEDHKTVIVRVTGLQEAEVVDQAAIPQRAATTDSVSPVSSGIALSLETSSLAEPVSAFDRPRVLVNPSQPLSVPDPPSNR